MSTLTNLMDVKAHPIFCGIFAVVSVYVLVEFALHFKRVRQLKAFRGPMAIPFLGNIYKQEVVFFIGYLAKLRKRYGRVFTFFAMKKPYLLICDPTVVRRVLSDPKNFFKGSDYSHQFQVIFGDGLVTSNHEKHKKDRTIFGKFFIRGNVSLFAETINKKTDQAIAQFLSAIPKSGEAFDVEKLFAALALRVFMSFSIGSDFSENRPREMEICKRVSEGSAAMGRLIIFGMPMWSWIPWVKTLTNLKENLLRDFKQIRDARKHTMETNPAAAPDDCLTAMLREEGMTDQEMEDHYVTFISAGHDTTAFFSSFLAYCIAEHPDVQQKLCDEIETNLKGVENITVDQIIEMKYLAKVMQEVLRMYAVIPIITREAAEDVYIKESSITIPKGTNVMIPMCIINRDPELWEFPSKFDPERFEGRGTTEFTSAKNGFFPFGYGSRTCIGNTLAQMEAAIFIIKLLRKFTLSKDTNYKLLLMGGISTTTAKGVKVVLTPK